MAKIVKEELLNLKIEPDIKARFKEIYGRQCAALIRDFIKRKIKKHDSNSFSKN